MFENADANSSPSQNNEFSNSAAEYLQRASAACASGDAVLGMHLYLAAFERATHGAYTPGEEAVEGLRQAWLLACKLKERSLAEYIFEKLEPYLAPDEVAACAEQLQRLALDKLEEFGLTREDLEDMTDMISQDFLGLEGGLVKVEHITAPAFGIRAPQPAEGGRDGEPDEVTGAALCTPDAPAAAGAADASDGESSATSDGTDGADSAGGGPSVVELRAAASAGTPARPEAAPGQAVVSTLDRITYGDIAGYDETVRLMRDFGVGMQKDPEFQNLVRLLNARHGLDRMPATDSLLFRSPAREDASRFMVATLGELDLPAIRMRMEENLQGMPVLCVMAQADNQPQLNAARNAFEGRGVLLLENLDLWSSPLAEMGSDDFGGFLFAQLSRGAREAISLIRSAVENPDVYVLASAAEGGEIDAFFYDLLEPLSIVDIDYPTSSEREDIWLQIAREHPSVRSIDRASLVRYSAGMPRYDIYLAAREAVEEAYKASLVARRYVPVTSDNLYDKLAAYQPLDSEEYQLLEDAVIRDFRRDLESLDDLLKGAGE